MNRLERYEELALAPDSKPSAAQARELANKAEALVRDLRRMLCKAITDAVEARRAAREAERAR